MDNIENIQIKEIVIEEEKHKNSSDYGIYNILLTVSKAMFLQMLVTMLSVIQHCKDYSKIVFYIMENDWDENLKNACNDFISQYPFCAVTFIKFDPERFAEIFMPWRGAYQTNYKLLAHLYLPDSVDRILYLDTDIVIEKDIHDLYYEDIDEYYLFAACHPTMIKYKNEEYANRTDKGKWPNLFVGGVYLMNINKFRNNNIDFKFYCNQLSKPGCHIELADESILNVCFWDQTKYFPYYKYNYMLGYSQKYKEAYSLSDDERIKLCNTVYYENLDEEHFATIVHFAGGADVIPKPWSVIVGSDGQIIGYFSNPKDIPEVAVHYKLWWDTAALLPQRYFNELQKEAIKNVQKSFTVLQNNLRFAKKAGEYYKELSLDSLINQNFIIFIESLKGKTVSILCDSIDSGRYITSVLKERRTKIIFSSPKTFLKDLTFDEWQQCGKAEYIINCNIHDVKPNERDGKSAINIWKIIKNNDNAPEIKKELFFTELNDVKDFVKKYMENLSDQVGQYQSNLKQLQDKNYSLNLEILHLSNENKELETKNSMLQQTVSNMQQYQNDLKQLQDKNYSLNLEIIRLSNENKELETKNSMLQQTITHMEKSHSWRITKPFRSIAWFFRGLFKKQK